MCNQVAEKVFRVATTPRRIDFVSKWRYIYLCLVAAAGIRGQVSSWPEIISLKIVYLLNKGDEVDEIPFARGRGHIYLNEGAKKNYPSGAI